MPLRNFKRIEKGQQVSAAEYNRLVDAVEALFSLSGSGDLSVDTSSSGQTVKDKRQKEIWLRTTGAAGGPDGTAYPWEEVYQPNIPGSWETDPYGQSGALESIPAFEANNSKHVPIGTVARGVLSETYDYYEFWCFPATSTTGTATTGTGTTATTGTTTTPAPCGSCSYECVAGQWVLITDSCSGPCNCIEPNWCCETCGGAGSVTATNCIYGFGPPQPNCGTTSTTTSTTYTGTSTTLGPTCTYCTWKCLLGTWYAVANNGPAYKCIDANAGVNVPGTVHCTSCGYPAVPCAESCTNVITYCGSRVDGPPPPPYCSGTCLWGWNDGPPGAWFRIDPYLHGCITNVPPYTPCSCDPPPGSGSCGQTVNTPCYWHTVTGTPPPFPPPTTTPPPTSCTGMCRWRWTGTVWVIVCTNCPTSCFCPSYPTFNGTVVNQTTETPCSNTTTTTTTTTTPPPTTTTTTTTTTTPAPCGTCVWICAAPVWNLQANNCTGVCGCSPPPSLCVAGFSGQLAQTQCTTTTTTTTTTTAAPTTTTTTTTTTCVPTEEACNFGDLPLPCGYCAWIPLFPPNPTQGACGTWQLLANACTGGCLPCTCLEPACVPSYPFTMGMTYPCG